MIFLPGFSKDEGNQFFYFYLIPFFFLHHLQVELCPEQLLHYGCSNVLAYDLTGCYQVQHNVIRGSLSLFTWLEAYCDFLFMEEFVPITPVGWPGPSDSPLVQWLSDPVRHWPVRHSSARQELDNTGCVLSSCPSSLLPEVHSYSLFPFLKHTA